MINSSDFWTMAVTYDIMYRHPTHPMFWSRGYNYDPVQSSLSNHLSAYSHGTLPISQDILEEIISHQVSLGFTSDNISDGVWLSEFEQNLSSYYHIDNLDLAGSGIAWNYLTDNRFIGYYYLTDINSLENLNGFHWDTSVSSETVIVGLVQDDPAVTMDSYIKILNYSFMGFQNGADISSVNSSVATPIENGFFHHPILNEYGTILLRPSGASPAFDPSYQISADAFLPTTDGFFQESIVANNSTIIAIQSHILNTSIHFGIDDTYLRDDAAFSADYLDALGEKNYLDMPPSGDGWFTHDGKVLGSRTDEDATDTFIAIAGRSAGYVEITHPDTGAILGTSVNGKGGIRAKFSIERGKVPVCPPNVLLRRLNRETGYGDIPNLLVEV